MRYFDARIIENRLLGGGYFVLRLGGCEALAGSRPNPGKLQSPKDVICCVRRSAVLLAEVVVKSGR